MSQIVYGLSQDSFETPTNYRQEGRPSKYRRTIGTDRGQKIESDRHFTHWRTAILDDDDPGARVLRAKSVRCGYLR